MSGLRIDRLGHLGDGIAEGPVYVARTLPGEMVTGTVEGGRIAAPRILSPSSQRVRAPCPHYRACGGCALMHASDAFVASWKEDVVRTALAAQGIEARFRQAAVSPPRSRRRAALSARRGKAGVTVGFHAAASPRVVPVPKCRVLTRALLEALPLLEALTAAGGTRKGELTFTLTETETGLDIAATGGKAADALLAAALARVADGAGVARLTWSGETAALFATPRTRFDGIAVAPPPGGFLQATIPGEAALRAAATEAVQDAQRVIDLFAGCGTFALPLARGAEIHAAEGDPALVAALEAGWRGAAELKSVTAETRDLFRNPVPAATLDRFEAAIIDPPRAGAAAQAAEIARSRLPRLAALSCNPATFARDAAILLAGGLRLDWVQVIDQFRWSPHVEIAAALSRP